MGRLLLEESNGLGIGTCPDAEIGGLLTPTMLDDKDLREHSDVIDELLRRLYPNDIVTITCIDYRERAREGYLLTSAGNIPHEHLMDDLHLVLKGKKALVLRCHTDCAKSKAEVPRLIGETEEGYKERLDSHTLQRLWRDAQVLLRDPMVVEQIRSGMYFCMACFDTDTSAVVYFEEESARLVLETCDIRQTLFSLGAGISSLVGDLMKPAA